MPRRRPPASGAMPSLAMATRMRLRARTVSWMLLEAADSPSAMRTGEGGAAATVGAATAPLGVSVWRVTMDMLRAFCVTPGAKAPLRRWLPEAKAEALAYLEAKANAGIQIGRAHV